MPSARDPVGASPPSGEHTRTRTSAPAKRARAKRLAASAAITPGPIEHSARPIPLWFSRTTAESDKSLYAGLESRHSRRGPAASPGEKAGMPSSGPITKIMRQRDLAQVLAAALPAAARMIVRPCGGAIGRCARQQHCGEWAACATGAHEDARSQYVSHEKMSASCSRCAIWFDLSARYYEESLGYVRMCPAASDALLAQPAMAAVAARRANEDPGEDQRAPMAWIRVSARRGRPAEHASRTGLE